MDDEYADLYLFKHFERSCLYQEAEVCKAMGLDSLNIIDKQIQRYRAEGFPENYGLPECGIILRNKSEKSDAVMNVWRQEVNNGSRRDQLSFMYAVWKVQPIIKIFDITSRDNKWVQWIPHIEMGQLFKIN